MMKKLVFALVALSLFAGCAKNRDREQIRRGDKEDILAKNAFISPNRDGTRGVWLGKMTVIDTSDSPAGTLFVGFQGDVQVGYFDFQQHQLQFRSLKGLQEGVETQNIKNPVILNWNIEHLDFALDERDGQTTNQEIFSNFKTWDERRYFRINWSEAKDISNSISMFPSTAAGFFGCWRPTNIRRVPGSMKTEADAINFNVEVNYQINLALCGAMAAQWAEGDLNFTATFKYSFKKLEPNGYKPKFYSNEQDPARYKYGHFQTVRKVLNPKNGRPHNVFMENRWAEKTHNFYFVKGFPEEYKWIWDHKKPESVFGQTNALLKAAGSKLRFEIYDHDHDGVEREFGDLRYSFINFIEELEAGGTPLGYGPSDTNPFTGEIIAANSMVWTGFLKYYMELLADVGAGAQEESSLFKQMNRSLNVVAGNTETIESLVSDWDHSHGTGKLFRHMAQENRFGLPFWNTYTQNDVGEVVVPTVMDYYNPTAKQDIKDGVFTAGFFSDIVTRPLSNKTFSFETRFLNGRPQLKVVNPLQVFDMKWLDRITDHPGALQHSAGIRAFGEAFKAMHMNPNKKKYGANNPYPYQQDIKSVAEDYFAHQAQLVEENQHGHCIMDMDEFASGFAGYLKASNLDLSNPKVRQDILNTVLYRVSIHEFGHNLNLRHNFYGSVDKLNFGLEKKGSIANFRGSNGLQAFEIDTKGNYVAVPSVHAEDGKRIQVSSSVMDYIRLEDEVNTAWAWEDYDVAAILDSYAPKGFDDKGHLYLFCTDEHTATSAICNRHDFGTTPSQILMSQIRSYDERYEMRNNRYGRAYWNTSGYARQMMGTMMSFKEFVPFWRTGLAEDLLRNKLSELGVKNNDLQTQQVTAMNREMLKVMKMTLAFFDGVVQQSRGTRDFRSEYDETTGAIKYLGITADKIYAMLFLAGDDAIYYHPNRIMIENSYLTYSGNSEIAQYTDRLWRNLLTNRQIAMEPGFINFTRFLYAKNATNYSNRGAASLIDSMRVIRIDNAEDLKNQYGIDADDIAIDRPLLETRLDRKVGTFAKGEEVVVVHVDGAYFMGSRAESDVAYTLFQEAIDEIQGDSSGGSLVQFNMDIREFHWLYELARTGSLQ